MARNKVPVREAVEPLRIEAFVNGEKKVFQEPTPEGFPPKLFSHLAEFWVRGFNAAHSDSRSPEQPVEEISLVDFAESRGRPINEDTEREGREGAKLHHAGLTFGQIARQVCRYRSKPAHRCKKPCTDRIRQAIKQHEERADLSRLARGD